MVSYKQRDSYGAPEKGSAFYSYLSDLLKKRAEMLTRRDKARAARSCGWLKKLSAFSAERLTKLAFRNASCSELSLCTESGVELELLLGETTVSSPPSSTSCGIGVEQQNVHLHVHVHCRSRNFHQ